MREKRRDYFAEGIPAWWWPSLVTTYALIERVLGGFGVGRFYDLTTNPNGNWIVAFLGVVSGTFVTNKWVKNLENRDTKSESITVTNESATKTQPE